MGDGADAGSDRTGKRVFARRRVQPRDVQRVQAQGRRVEADRVSLPARAAASLLGADRQSACAHGDLGADGPDERRARARVLGAAPAREAAAGGARDRVDHDGRAAARGNCDPWWNTGGDSAPRAGSHDGPHPGEAPLDPGAAAGGRRGSAGSGRAMSTSAMGQRAGWWFVLPALALITGFYFLPVAGSLLLSLTDFDIYAIASPDNARFVGFGNYIALLHNPVFWTAVRNTFYFALVGGPLTVAVSLAAALLVNARLVRFKGFFRTIYFVPFVTTLVAVAIV